MDKDGKDLKDKELRKILLGAGAARIADYLETATQISKYHTKGGHGFAAEDAHTLIDRLMGKDAHVVGKNNIPNGPDRIVDGQAIQSKYYQTARKTIESAFDPKTGKFRYPNQKLEVPADQYEECINLMKQKIKEGKVPGVKDPEKAKDIVKKGKLTYKQAVNIAKAGKIESLIYDAAQQAVMTTHVLGVSFVVSLALAFWRTKDWKEATKFAIKQAVSVAGATFVAGIITSQILRTKAAATGTIIVRHGVKKIAKTSLGKNVIEQIAKASLGKTVYGTAAINHVSKLLRSNAISALVTTTIITAPDFYRALIAKTITWEQFFKNLAVNASSVSGGIGGWMIGTSIGSAILPGVGTVVGGVLGSLLGGIGGHKLTKTVADMVVEDDTEKIQKILEKVLVDVGSDYLLFEEEFKQLVAKFMEKLKDEENWLGDMVRRYRDNGESGVYKYAYNICVNICDDIVKQREEVKIPNSEEIKRYLSNGEVLELKKQQEEVLGPIFTPLNDLPGFSIAKGKIVRRDPLLESIVVKKPKWGQFFIPESNVFDIKTGEKILVQIVREWLEDKPSLISEKIVLPFYGCLVIFDNKKRVKILDGRQLLKDFKAFAERWNISLLVYNPELCLSNLQKLENIFRNLKEEKIKLPFIWKDFYTFLLEEYRGEVIVPQKGLCSDLVPFEELTGFKIPCKEVSLKKLLKEVEFSKFSNYLFSQIKTFEGGYLITGEVGG